MEIVKVGIVVAAGLGSTWVARQATDAWLGPSRAMALVQTAEPSQRASEPAAEQSPAPATDDASRPAPPAVPEMSREEMEEELRRAQEELAGTRKSPAGSDVREFKPTRPLPADLPIALPSDI